MYAGKLSRFAGLVFVLAALAGGAGAAIAGAEHGTGGPSGVVESANPTALSEESVTMQLAEYDWQ